MNQINVDPISYVWLYILMSFKNIQVIIIFWTAEDTTQGQNNTHNNTGTKIHSEKLFQDRILKVAGKQLFFRIKMNFIKKGLFVLPKNLPNLKCRWTRL